MRAFRLLACLFQVPQHCLLRASWASGGTPVKASGCWPDEPVFSNQYPGQPRVWVSFGGGHWVDG